MTINISDNNPRISYTATSGQTAFTVPFVFFNDADLNVYINDTLKTITTDYTVTGGDGSTGSITLTSGATSGDIVVITRDVALERTTDFPSSGPFQVASLNTELDTIIAMVADMEDLAERGLRLSDSDTSASLVLADKDARKGTVLAFNATTGAVEVGPTIADTETIASIKADIATLADIEDGTDATDAIQTVAGISSNVTTVAGISSDVTTVAGNNANVTTVAGNDANITTVAGISANVTTVAGISSDVTSVAGDATDIGTVATNIANVNTVAANDANITTVAGQTTNMQNITDNLTAVQNAATNATNAATSASNASTSESNAAASAASAAASFDAFDDRYLGAKPSDPATDNDGDALDAGDQYFNTTDNELKVYNGSAWQSASVVGGTVTSLTTSSLDANGGTIDGTVIGGTTPAAGTFTTGDFNTSLNVDGTITSDGLIVDGTYTDVKFKTNQGRLDLWLTDTDTTDGQVRIRGDANTLSFITNTTNAMTIDASQNVGIGTSVPSTSLDVVRNGVQPLRVQSTSGTEVAINMVNTGGNVQLEAHNGKFNMDADGVGINVTNPSCTLNPSTTALQLYQNSTAGAGVRLTSSTTDFEIVAGDNATYVYNTSSDPIFFGTNDTTALTIDASQNVGIGTSSPSFDLDVRGSDPTIQSRATNSSGTATLNLYGLASNGSDLAVTQIKGVAEGATPASSLTFSTRNSSGTTSERMRIDSSGNLLVGVTSTTIPGVSNTTAGVSIRGDDGSFFSRSLGSGDTNNVVTINRTTADGNILGFNKDGSTVGSIGTANGDLHIDGLANHSGIRFQAGSLLPRLNGSDTDNTIDLGYDDGSATHRFKDLYLGGVLYMNVDSGAGSPDIKLQRTDTSVGLDNQIGSLQFWAGEDGSEEKVAAVRAVADEAYSSSSSATRLVFETTTSGSTSATERMVIRSGGSILMSRDDAALATTGHYFDSSGYVYHTRSGANVLYLNRKSTDGDIATFYKDNAAIGSIGVSGNGIYFGDEGDTAIVIDSNADAIIPFNPGSRTIRDNHIDLGSSSGRYDDVFATNGTIQTSDRNEKQQIASLTDAEITAAKAISKLFKTFKWNDKVEAKGDAARTHAGVISQDVQQAMSDAGLDAANYAFWCSDTWWETQTEVPAVEAVEAQDAVYDDDGNLVSEAVEAVAAQDAYTRTDTYDTAEEAPDGATERTRLGIRYPELLAFIGAATEQRLADIETRLTALEN